MGLAALPPCVRFVEFDLADLFSWTTPLWCPIASAKCKRGNTLRQIPALARRVTMSSGFVSKWRCPISSIRQLAIDDIHRYT